MPVLKIGQIKTLKWKNLIYLTPIVFILILVLLELNYFSNRIYPGVSIAGNYVGSKTKKEAIEILKANIKPKDIIIINANDDKFDLSLQEMDFSYNFEKSVDTAFNVNRSPAYQTNLINKIYPFNTKENLGLDININQTKLDEYLQIISSQVGKEPVLPDISLEKDKVVVKKGESGEVVDGLKFRNELLGNLAAADFKDISIPIIKTDGTLTDQQAQSLYNRAEKIINKKISLLNEYDSFSVNADKLIKFLDAKNIFNDKNISDYIDKEIAPKVDRGPQNAVFRFEEGKVKEFAPAKEGLTVDNDLLVPLIKDGLAKLENSEDKNLDIQIPVKKEKPAITLGEVNNLGIKELLGRGSSKFAGSIAGRIHNVGLASSKFNGVLIPPDSVFSFNDALGDVSVYTGYKQAYVIKDGKTVLGDGGGVCQVSTTFFRAILNAGLPITERKPHSYRVGYYEQDSGPGLDATVFAPTSDLKFKNDTPSYLLVQTEFDPKKMTLIFEIYGTPDGRKVTLTKPRILSQTAPPPDVFIDDPTLPTGKIIQTEHKAWGAKVSFDYKVEKDGVTIIDKTFLSVYRPWAAVFQRGTGPAI